MIYGYGRNNINRGVSHLLKVFIFGHDNSCFSDAGTCPFIAILAGSGSILLIAVVIVAIVCYKARLVSNV